MITLTSTGDFDKIKGFFKRITDNEYLKRINEYGEQGVSALSAATPKDSGLTADSWGYDVESNSSRKTEIVWTNSNVNKNVNVAVLIQYGHGTGTGGYVPPKDYINPAMASVFKNIEEDVWSEVTRK